MFISPKLFFTILVFSFLLIFSQTARSQCESDNRLGLKYFELKDRVKKIVTYKTVFEKDKQTGLLIKGKKEVEDELSFNIQGISDVRLGKESNTVKVKREYTVKFICDSNNRISLIKYFFEDGKSLDGEIYKYDEDGRLIEKSEYSTDGILTRNEKFAFDKNGNLLEERIKKQIHPEHFKPERYDVYVMTKSVYKYDEKNNLIEEKAFRGENSLYSIENYQYNSSNKLIKRSYYNEEGTALSRQNTYKYEGENLVEEIEYRNLCSKRACQNPVKSEDGFFSYATKYNYKYDSKGNWIEKIESTNGIDENSNDFVLEAIYSRNISYFKN